MQSFTAGEDITVAIPLVWNGEPFVPDGGNVTWLVRGQNGSIVQPISTMHGVTDSKIYPVVPADVNDIVDDLEKRTIVLGGSVAGDPFVIMVSYQLHEFLNMTATEADVRTFIGIDTGELPDDEINLTNAYFETASRLTSATLVAALAGTQKHESAANKAIVAQAVLDLMPSLQARISMMESDGTSKVQRFPIDLEKLEGKARDQIAKSVAIITGVTPTGLLMSATSTQADPITGA